MTRKIFRRVGLRRDFNFADLSDPKEALNNLLDTLVDDIDSTFISEDLDAIRNIFAEGLTNDGYQNIIGSAVQTTDTNGINQAIVELEPWVALLRPRRPQRPKRSPSPSPRR